MSNRELRWHIGDVGDGDTGSLEFAIDDIGDENLYPVTISFDSETTYSGLKVFTSVALLTVYRLKQFVTVRILKKFMISVTLAHWLLLVTSFLDTYFIKFLVNYGRANRLG